MWAVEGARVLRPDGSFEKTNVVIDGTRIYSVGQELPEGCEVIAGGGRYLTPGLIDGHSHLGLEEEVFQTEGDDVNEATDPATPHLRAVDGINPFDIAFEDALKAGVTRALVVPGSANVLGGQGAVVRTGGRNPAGFAYIPSWGMKAALGENPKRVYGRKEKSPMTRMASAAILREKLSAAASWKGEEKDDDADRRFRLFPLVEVIRGERPLFVHAHRADDILTALRIADEFGIRLVVHHGTEAHLVAGELARRGVPVVQGPLLVNRAKVEMKELNLETPARLVASGVRFSFMTDHPVVPIQYLVVQTALAVREGLSAEAAMRALTSDAADILGVKEDLGSILPGKIADLVLWSGHPLDLSSRALRVWIDGHECHRYEKPRKRS